MIRVRNPSEKPSGKPSGKPFPDGLSDEFQTLARIVI